jgi:DNA-binding response OmpR family regulator
VTSIRPNRLFITDDDLDDREFLTLALERYGFTGKIATFSNGAKLLDHLSANPGEFPGLIVLDLNMPHKNGFETLTELKSNDLLKHIPVVILTSSSREADEATCKNLGSDHFFRKPSNITDYKELSEFMVDYMARG